MMLAYGGSVVLFVMMASIYNALCEAKTIHRIQIPIDPNGFKQTEVVIRWKTFLIEIAGRMTVGFNISTYNDLMI